MIVAAVVLLLMGSGCISNPYSEFRGTIAHRSRVEPALAMPKVYQIADQSSSSVPEKSQIVFAYGIPSARGSIVIVVHDPQRESSRTRQWRLTNDSILVVYFYAMDHNKQWQVLQADRFWRQFLLLDPAARERIDGVHRLVGKIDVERWKHTLDFRIRMNMRSQQRDPVVVDGVLTNYQRWGFHPGEWLAMLLFQTGLFGEG